MNKQEWVAYFEQTRGRRPSPEEYFAAKKAGEFKEATETQESPNSKTVGQKRYSPEAVNTQLYSGKPRKKFHFAYLLLMIPVLALVFYLGTQFDWTNKNSTDKPTSSSTTTTTTSSSEKLVVDLSDYEVSFYTEGENAFGQAFVQIDSYPYISPATDSFLSNPIISISKASNLSNGDKVLVELHLDASKATELGLVVKGSFAKYFTVSGLGNTPVEDSKAIAERAIENYRQAINQALRSRDGSLILDQFTSSSNASYLYIKEYVENGAVAENVVGYEYENSNVYDVSTGGDTISFQIEFRARTVYADGRRSELVKNVRSCVLKKVDGKYRFEVYE